MYVYTIHTLLARCESEVLEYIIYPDYSSTLFVIKIISDAKTAKQTDASITYCVSKK